MSMRINSSFDEDDEIIEEARYCKRAYKEEEESKYYIIANASEDLATNDSERHLLFEFRELYKQYQEKNSAFTHMILQYESMLDEDEYEEYLNNLSNGSNSTLNELHSLDEKLLKMSKNPFLDNIYSSYQEIKDKEAAERYREKILEGIMARGRTTSYNYASRSEEPQDFGNKQTITKVEPKKDDLFLATDEEMPKTRTFRSVLLGILTSLITNLSYGLIFFVIELLIYLLYFVPIVKSLLNLLFAIRKDSPDLFAACAGLTLTVFIVSNIINKFSKVDAEQKIIGKTSAIVISVAHIPFLIMNMFTEGSSFLTNIVMLILAAIFFYKSY